MRSYTITIRPDSIAGTYRSFVLSRRTIVFVCATTVTLLLAGLAAFVAFVLLPYAATADKSERAIRLARENEALSASLSARLTQMEEFKGEVLHHLAVTEKLNFLFGVEDIGAGGFTPTQGDVVEELQATIEMVEGRFEKLESYLHLLDQIPIRFPIAGAFNLSSGFGARRSPFSRSIEMHKGLDLAARRGTAILAAGAGTVKFAGRWNDIGDPQYARLGLFVQIAHGESEYETIYGHCDRLLVRAGDTVRAGQAIALVGNTGWSTAPHLHFSIIHRERYVDPKFYLLYFDAELIENVSDLGGD